MTKTTTGVATLAVAAVLFLALNGLAGLTLRGLRLDLTENALYTISDGTEAILADLDEPITLRFYFSRGMTTDLPEVLTYANRVRELLDEYVAAGDGLVRLEEIDPVPFSEAEDEAVALGVQGVPVAPTGDPFYFGLVASNATDERAVIPFIDISQEQLLEYDLTRFVYRLANPGRATLGVMSTLPVMGSPAMAFPGAPPAAPPWFLIEQLRELYEVQEVPVDVAAIPDEIDVLMVVHPKDLGEQTLYAIDQFVLGGGRLLAFVDPHCEEDRPPQDPTNPLAGMGEPRSSDLGPLLETWGVGYDPTRVVGDRASAMYVNTGSGGRQEAAPYIAWIDLDAETIAAADANVGDPVKAGLSSLRFASAGPLEILDGRGPSSREVLLMTSEDSGTFPVSEIQFFPQPEELLASFVPDNRQPIAIRVYDRAVSAFPDGPPASDPTTAEGEDGPPAPSRHLSESVEDVHVVIVSDADMLADSWWVRFQNFFGSRLASPDAGNGHLVINLLDSLSGSTELMKVRGRQSFEKPFRTIEDLRRQADMAYRAEQRELEARLTETERRLAELQRSREDGSSLILTDEQRQEIERFEDQRLETRKQLRRVRHDLGKEIESLKSRLKFANVLGVPLLIGGLILLRTLTRRR